MTAISFIKAIFIINSIFMNIAQFSVNNMQILVFKKLKWLPHRFFLFRTLEKSVYAIKASINIYAA